MATRLEFHEALCDILKTRRCYFQPPESVKLVYPCFVYSPNSPDVVKANNRLYNSTACYEVTYISKDYDETIVNTMLNKFEMCRHSRHFVADNLHHDTFTIYY